MKGRQGFTLMELLVVLLIIGILSTVALRTIDATRDRSLFDQTTKEMNQLIQAMVGNPDLTYDGRRVDFGYFGDMEKLPDSLRALVKNPGDTDWHGPYLRLIADTADSSYRFDGWGHLYTYIPTEATIHTFGNGKFPMTMKIVDDTSQLYNNIIAGTITDIDDNAPDSAAASGCTLRLYYNNEALHPAPRVKVPSPGGFYEYSPAGADTVPIGIHKLVAHIPGESLTRYVTVLPRSKTIVDFKFTSPFWKLRMVGEPDTAPGGKGFLIHVANYGTQNVTVDSLRFLATSESLYMREFRIGMDWCGTPLLPGPPGYGPGGTVPFTPPGVTIAPDDWVELYFNDFRVTPTGVGDTSVRVVGDTFKFRFSDGSKITAIP